MRFHGFVMWLYSALQIQDENIKHQQNETEALVTSIFTTQMKVGGPGQSFATCLKY